MRGRLTAIILAGFLVLTLLACQFPQKAGAQPVLVQSPNNVANGAASVSVTIATPTANDLLVAICGTRAAITITGPSGWSTAKNQNSTVSQGIFYKIATGSESSISCSGSGSNRWGISVYEYSGMVTSSPLDAVNATSSTGSSSSPASGSVTTTNADDLLIAGVTTGASTSFSAWSNSFTEENDFVNGGAAGSRNTFGAADHTVTSTATYSTTATAGASGSWTGQIAAFKMIPPVLSTDIVDGSGNPVASPSASMGATSRSFFCSTTSGTLGISTQKISVSNTTSDHAWTLSIAATGGSTSTWSDGSGHTYAFNNSAGSGCTSGQLAVNPAVSTLTPASGCTNTGVSLGSSSSFVSGTTDSVSIASASASASINCSWTITGVTLSQKIPALQNNGTYSINMTLTVVAN